MKKILFIVLYMICFLHVRTQNLEKIGKADMMTIHGGINFTSLFYYGNNPYSRRDPFTQYASGNLTINFLDVAVPVTYSYSNHKGKFTQPFNQFSISPTYKWIKTFVGYHSLNYSPYTLAGHVFAGGGIELTPGKWKIGLMHGKFLNAVPFNEQTGSEENMSYKRMGSAAMISYSKNNYSVNAVFFHAADELESIPFIPINTLKTPMENAAASIGLRLKLSKSFSYEGEYALSVLTRNILSEESYLRTNYLSFLINSKSSTASYSSYKNAISYSARKFNLKAQFEHIDPGYQTLGGYYFNNDLENYTLAPTLQLAKGKLTLGCNAGFQRNNLQQLKAGTTNRMVGSANISFVPNKKWILNGQYSNFTTYTKNRIQSDLYFQNPMDTLNFYQVSKNATLMVIHTFGNDSLKKSLSLSFAHMTSAEATGNSQLFSVSTFQYPALGKIYNSNLGFSVSGVKSKTSITLVLNANYSVFLESNTLFAGPGVNISKANSNNSFRIVGGGTFNYSMNESGLSGKVANYRLAVNLSPKFNSISIGKPVISLTANFLHRFRTSFNERLLESNAQLALSWNF